jgi:hypothetical protein
LIRASDGLPKIKTFSFSKPGMDIIFANSNKIQKKSDKLRKNYCRNKKKVSVTRDNELNEIVQYVTFYSLVPSHCSGRKIP